MPGFVSLFLSFGKPTLTPVVSQVCSWPLDMMYIVLSERDKERTENKETFALPDLCALAGGLLFGTGTANFFFFGGLPVPAALEEKC